MGILAEETGQFSSPYIGAGAQVGTGILNQLFARRNMRLQNQSNMQMAKYQYNQNLDMWKRANEYNSPKMQMSRYREAGLNPNLIYGQGTSGNSPNVLPQYQAPRQEMSIEPLINPMNVLNAYQDVRMKQATIDNLKADRRIKDAQGTIAEAKALYEEMIQKAKVGITHWQMMEMRANGVWTDQKMQKFFYYSAPDNKWYPRKEMEDGLNEIFFSQAYKPVIELQKTSADVRRMNLDSDLKEQVKTFNMSGGKFFNPIIQLMRVLFGR